MLLWLNASSMFFFIFQYEQTCVIGLGVHLNYFNICINIFITSITNWHTISISNSLGLDLKWIINLNCSGIFFLYIFSILLFLCEHLILRDYTIYLSPNTKIAKTLYLKFCSKIIRNQYHIIMNVSRYMLNVQFTPQVRIM